MGKNETGLGACICMNHATVLLKTLCNKIHFIFQLVDQILDKRAPLRLKGKSFSVNILTTFSDKHHLPANMSVIKSRPVAVND